METTNTNKKVCIVGGGPVGGAVGFLLAKKGYTVDLYEQRPAISCEKGSRGRGISMTLARRGLDAVETLGLSERVLSICTPLHSRMVHERCGARTPITYHEHGQCLYAVRRACLIKIILEALAAEPNVNVYYEHQLVECDFLTGQYTVQNKAGERCKGQADIILGCDGATSKVREIMSENKFITCERQLLQHGYKELAFPPNSLGQWEEAMNFLHVWPRGEKLVVALPNTVDKSFMADIFMPLHQFNNLTTEHQVVQLFSQHFPDILQHVGRESLVKAFFANNVSTLNLVKCDQYHAGSRGLLLGDAAHAMPPFLGQGLNTGLEDVLVFMGLVDKYNGDFERILPAFTERRSRDGRAITDLSVKHYNELKNLEYLGPYLQRKMLDYTLARVMPGIWRPFYTLVVFTRTPFHQCIEQKEWQDKVLRRGRRLLLATSCIVTAVLLFRSL